VPKTIRVLNFDVEERDHIFGISVWRQIIPRTVPCFRIFKYIGWDKKKDLHFFKARDSELVIWKNVGELTAPGFGPFLFDFARINAALSKTKP
jgi:hypothetical protein